MARKYFTRADIQQILSQNNLGAPVTYGDREVSVDMTSGNAIVFSLISPPLQPYADDEIHMIRYNLQIVHFHKKKLDSIAGFMKNNFHILPAQLGAKQSDTDWIADYYRFNIFTNVGW